MTIIFRFMRVITFYTSWSLRLTSKGYIFPFLVILTLGNFRFYIGASYCRNVVSCVEALIDKSFSRYTILEVLDINLDDDYVQLQRNFDNLWFYVMWILLKICMNLVTVSITLKSIDVMNQDSRVSQETTLVLSNTRELDRVPSTE